MWREILRDGERGWGRERRRYCLADVDVARDHRAVDGRLDDSVLEIELRAGQLGAGLRYLRRVQRESPEVLPNIGGRVDVGVARQ